jgi:hypothetical protein
VSPLLTAVPDLASYDCLHETATTPRHGEYRKLEAHQPDRFAQFDRKLESLDAPTGPWTDRGWKRPNASAIEAARDTMYILRDLDLVPDRILATAKGGVGVRFTCGARYGSLEFLNSGDIVQLRMGNGTPEAFPVEPTPEGTRQALVDLRLFLNS